MRGWTVLPLAGACAASAGLSGAAQNGVAPGWLALVGFVPMLTVVRPERPAHTGAVLALTYFLFSLLTIHWVRFFGANFLWAVPLAAAYGAAFMMIPSVGCLGAYAARSRDGGLLMLPACWMLAEMGQRRASLGLTWALAGQPLADWPVLSQAAALAGPESLSFLVLATNVSLALWLRRCSRWSRLAALAQGPGLLVLAAVWGAQHDGAAAHADANDSIDVAVIQPNASAAMKQDLSQRGDLLEHYDRLVNRTLGESPQLIVLPEGALPGLVRYDDGLTDWARSTVIRTGLPLLFGSIDHPEGEAQRLFNVAVLITPYNTVATYAKTRLVPLAEYVPAPGPLRSWASALRGDLVDYAPGEELTLFELGESVRFGVMICYEDVFADLGRAYANAGATMLVALVNTQSFDRSAQPLQHLRRARLTAISAGLPMIRCGNSGVSAMIDPYGRIRGTVRDALGRPVGVPAARVLTVPLTARATTYRRLGDGPIAIMVGLYAIMILVARRRMGHPAVSTESLLIPRPSE